MRKLLIWILILLLLTAGVGALWIFAGERISLAGDRFGTIEQRSVPVDSISYEGSGSGGILRVKDLGLSLNSIAAGVPQPSFGSSKDGQLAMAVAGKIFTFGSLAKPGDDTGNIMSAGLPPGDAASVSIRHSALSWPTPFEVNYMTGTSTSWRRHSYQQLTWKKASGTELEMLWRFEQFYYPADGWSSASMTEEGVTGLIKLEIKH